MCRLQTQARLILSLFIILIAGMVSASAAVYAEYEPETSLYFKRPPPPFTSDTMVGTKLGQFRIWSDDGNIYTPVITLSPDVASPPIKMTGLFSWNHPNDPEERDLTFHVIFLAYREGSNPGYISQSWSEPRVAVAGNIANVQGTSAQPYLVDIFLINTNADINSHGGIHATANSGNPGSGFFLNTPYAFTNPFNPCFGLATANQPNSNMYDYMNGTTPKTGQNDPHKGAYVPVSSPSGTNSGHATTPIIPGGAMSGGEPGQGGGNGGIVYGDEPISDPIIHTLFSLESEDVPIILSQFTGTQVRQINTAMLEVVVENGTGGEKISVDVLFTDDSPVGWDGFHLLHETPGPTIPYNLYWGDTTTQITKDSSIQWNNLVAGEHTKTIYMGRIDETFVNQAAEGRYKSTITVTLTNSN
ncbi:MAG: hypothetical protein ACOX0D_04585 [Sphaerochaeta sp.]|jgi:hypothetical protein